MKYEPHNYKTHTLCTFEFTNTTQIIVAVPNLDKKGRERTFLQMFDAAKIISWNGDECRGRGHIKSFTVGPVIFAGYV